MKHRFIKITPHEVISKLKGRIGENNMVWDVCKVAWLSASLRKLLSSCLRRQQSSQAPPGELNYGNLDKSINIS
jgi:hypothetical protein